MEKNSNKTTFPSIATFWSSSDEDLLKEVLQEFRELKRGSDAVALTEFPEKWLKYGKTPHAEPVQITFNGNTRKTTIHGCSRRALLLLGDSPSFEGLNPEVPDGKLFTPLIEQLLVWCLNEELKYISAPQDWSSYFENYYSGTPMVRRSALRIKYKGVDDSFKFGWEISAQVADPKYKDVLAKPPHCFDIEEEGGLLPLVERSKQKLRVALVLTCIFAAKAFEAKNYAAEQEEGLADNEPRLGEQEKGKPHNPFIAAGPGLDVLNSLRDLTGVEYPND